jgi:FMN reductase
MTNPIRAGVVVGNPKPKSRTYEAALLLAQRITGRAPDIVIDLVDLGAGLLDWSDPAVDRAVQDVKGVDLLVVASPTFKATYTGLLKIFLDRFASDALDGVVAIPLMLGGSPGHQLAPELTLKPVLVEIGATTPTRALYLLDRTYQDSTAVDDWLTYARPQLDASLRGRSSRR